MKICLLWFLFFFALMGGCSPLSQQKTSIKTPEIATQTPTTANIGPFKTTATNNPTEKQVGWNTVSSWPGANNIRTILSASDGSIWVGGPETLTRWTPDTKEAIIYVFDPKLPDYNSKIVDLAQTPDQSIWVATFGYGLFRFHNETWVNYSKENGLPDDYLSSITVSGDGRLWVNISFYARDRGDNVAEWDKTMKFMINYDGNKWSVLPESIGYAKIMAGADSSIWALEYADFKPYIWNRTYKYNGKKWETVSVLNEKISTMAIAPDGSVWVATDDALYRYINQQWKKVSFPDLGESHPRVSSIAISKNSDIWLGFSINGLDDVYRCGDRINMGNELGVYRYDGKSWTHYTDANGLVDNKICAITIDNKDRVWVGTYDKGISMFDGQHWQSYIVK